MKMVDESLQSTSRSRKTVERVVVWTRSGDERKQVDLRNAERQQRQDSVWPLPPPCSCVCGCPGAGEVLTADLGAQLVLPDGVKLLILLLRELQALLLHLVDLLLCTQGLLGHHQVILQHVLLLPPPLYPGILNLSGF